jgi:peptidoglycan hydrolase-like protein with peptidoglycan-binding domain
MTAATIAQSFAHLPLQAGGIALTHAGRAAGWVISRYMRSPLTNSAVLALVVTTAMAGSNALYGQHARHPAPLFTPTAATAEIEPVIPATKPKGLSTKPLVVGTPKKLAQPATDSVTTESIGNAEVFEVQRKLEAMKLFTGTIDGYYGPQTAKAIRKFEEQHGLKPTGQLTDDIVEAIRKAPLAVAQPAPAPEPAAVEPAVVVPKTAVPAAKEKAAVTVTLPKVEAPKLETAVPEAKPAAAVEETVTPQSLAALVEPAPLDLTTGSIETPKKKGATVLGRPLPETPGEALEMAADTAGEAIDTIINGVQTVAMNRPGTATPFASEEEVQVATANVAEASPDNPQVGVPLLIDDEPQKPGTEVTPLDTAATAAEARPVSVNDPVTVAKVQRGLGSLGFLHGPADGVAGEATAKAIRNFEVYFNYKVTGRISPELLDLLVENGASI